MPSDANRPCPEPLTAEMVKDVLWANGSLTNAALCEPIARTFNLVLAGRLAQAQREAVAGAYEDAAQVCQKLFSDQIENCNIACHATCAVHIKERTPADAQNALELARVRAAQEEAKWWADVLYRERDGLFPGKATLTREEKYRLDHLENRKMELERALETTK